ncbi:MAG: EAL domain-containing protein [bacterium]
MEKKPIRLLITDSSEEHAEQLISILRNSGIAVRPRRAATLEEFQNEIDDKPLDLILCVISDHSIDLQDVSTLIAKANKDLPLIAICHDCEFDDITQYLERGANAISLDDNPALLSHLVKREVGHLKARRRLRGLEVMLRDSEKRCNALLDSSKDAIAYMHDGMHVYANPAYIEMFGFNDSEELEGLPMLDLMQTESLAAMKKLFKSLSKGQLPSSNTDMSCVRQDGKKLELSATFSPATIDGEPCTQVVMRMQGLDANVQEEMDRLKNMDLLTGLWNRSHLDTRLDEAIQKAQQGHNNQFFFYLEPDNFKTIQEQVGLANSDLILIDIANSIKEIAGEDAISARYSDHTFTFMKIISSQQEAEKLAEILRSTMEQNISEVGKKSVATPCSIGLLLIGENFENAAQIVNAAAETQRKAAQKEGNAVSVYSPAEHQFKGADEDRHWVHLIKDALSKNNMLLAYQPVVNLHGAEGEHYEVLIRMKGPKGDAILPEFFLPPAQRNSLMPQIDRWVIEKSIAQLKQREKEGVQTIFFVKITIDTLSDPSILPWLAKQLQAARISGESLVFEIPESAVVTNLKPVRQFYNGLRQLHCKMTLSQFGSGLNSFQLLKQLPVDFLKIDRSFMIDLSESTENQEKVTEITDQAHAAGKLTIVEHVEDAQSMSILYSCGVNFVQGNFLQEPEQVLAYEF